MSNWTLLAPGPSLRMWSVDTMFLDGPVVAINNAILAPIPIDFWICQDPAAKFQSLWETMDPDRRRSILVWCKYRHEDAWKKLGFRTWGHPDTETEFQQEFVPSAPSRCAYGGLTATAALARMVGNGATYIRVYGMDLEGIGYGYGIDNRSRQDAQWSARWKHETSVMERLIEGWKQQGVIIARMTAPPTDQRAN